MGVKEILAELTNLDLESERRKELESALAQHQEEYRQYLKLKEDVENILNPLPENPFFLSKLKNRMEENRKVLLPPRLQWTPYAILASMGIAFGVFMGNQVVYNQDVPEETFNDEFLISDYELEDPFTLVLNENFDENE